MNSHNKEEINAASSFNLKKITSSKEEFKRKSKKETVTMSTSANFGARGKTEEHSIDATSSNSSWTD